MPTVSNRDLLDQYVAAFNAGDLARAGELLTREYFGYVPQPGEPTAPESFSQIVQALRGAFPDLRLRLEEVAERGDQLAGRMSLEGTFTGRLWGVPGDGKPHSLKEIAEKKKLTLKELDRVLDFLTRYGFVAMLGNYVEINPEFRSLLKEI